MNQKHQEDLAHIRSMMERSSRFISLSGLSGVFAGLSALIGGLYVYQLFKINGVDYFGQGGYDEGGYDEVVRTIPFKLVSELVVTGIVILVCAFVFGLAFTIRKSKKYNFHINVRISGCSRDILAFTCCGYKTRGALHYR